MNTSLEIIYTDLISLDITQNVANSIELVVGDGSQAVEAALSASNAADSALSASTSASTATTKAAVATTQAGLSATSATNSANSASSTAALLLSFRNVYLGAFSSDANAATFATANSIILVNGICYENTTTQKVRVYNGSTWADQDADAQTQSANATASAVSASASAATATTQASNAANSASSAANSATTASTQSDISTAQAVISTAEAVIATNQAGIATTQATNSANSASASASSAVTASTQASNAFNSATAAAGSATSASGSATSASGSASTATTQATNAGNSATAASGSASAAATSATNSASSATAAAGSATSASGSATSATTQANNAASSASSASTSASNASTSASGAATSATASSTSATNFDKRYLGAKASQPSLDNQGATLQTGALYWDTVLLSMRSWSGTAWVDPLSNMTTEITARLLADQQLLGGIEYVNDLIGSVVVELTGLNLGTNIQNIISQLGYVGDLAGLLAKAIGGGSIILEAGSVTDPSLSNAQSHGTGLFFPAVGQTAIGTAGVEAIRIDASQRLGVGTTTPTSKLDVNDSKVRVRSAQTPASATASGNQGDICWDSSYVYVCVATNSWKRSAIAAW